MFLVILFFGIGVMLGYVRMYGREFIGRLFLVISIVIVMSDLLYNIMFENVSSFDEYFINCDF